MRNKMVLTLILSALGYVTFSTFLAGQAPASVAGIAGVERDKDRFELTSPAFLASREVPMKYAEAGEWMSPPLAWNAMKG